VLRQRACVADAKSYTSASYNPPRPAGAEDSAPRWGLQRGSNAYPHLRTEQDMTDKPQSSDDQPAGPEANSASPAVPSVRKAPGHRGADMRDAMAEMTERAHIISQEAGSKIAAAMKDVISAAAGIAGFAIESARDLVQFMVRRGQMTQEEADKLLREAEEAHGRRPAAEKNRATATKIATDRATAAKAEAIAREAIARAEAMAMGGSPPAFATPRPAVPPRAAYPTPPAQAAPLPPSTAKPAKKADKPSEPKKAHAAAAKPAAKTAARSAAKPVAKSAKSASKAAKPMKKPAAKKRK
jgi:polyhydroxyalkanoate synthesis regulator phasin